ncbi:MAG TPA: hypothetical protein VLT79_11520 [Gemmatimonadales bacterium]|nr:hypothetical protein [Gemmatimonadales bacterium]
MTMGLLAVSIVLFVFATLNAWWRSDRRTARKAARRRRPLPR